MTDAALLLAEINRDVPPGVDWKAGARRYLADMFEKLGDRPGVELYSLIKPFAILGDTGANLAEATSYFYNFVNLIALLKPRSGTRVLDVACGGGWMSHYLAKLGCAPFGIDISEDFIRLARRRLAEDPCLSLGPDAITGMFAVHDIEVTPLPPERDGTFDVAVLESCLHHFYDPVAAMTNIARALADDGVAVAIEGENRHGPIRDEFMAVMRETDTLERPYARAQLVEVLALAGLPHVEFLGKLNGWFAASDPAAQNADRHILDSLHGMNLAVCAKDEAALNRLFPHRTSAAALRFGRGFHPQEGGFRWCGPSGEITVAREAADLRLRVHGHLALRQDKPQAIIAYALRSGARHEVVVSPEAPDAEIAFGRIAAGERLLLCSMEAWNPAWDGAGEPRLLSFMLRTDD